MKPDGMHPDWHARFLRVHPWITRRTVVVFACPITPATADDARMEQVGSGVLYEEEGDTFVLTAAHVTDWIRPNEHVLAVKGAVGRGKPLSLVGTSWKSSVMPRSRNRDDDPEDVAAIYVPADVATALRLQCEPIRWEQLGLEHDVRADDGVSISGFPLAASREDADGHITYKIIPSATKWQPPSPKLVRTYGARALFPAHATSPKKMASSNPALDIPHPKGYSGGGVWLHQRGVPQLRQRWTEDDIRLLGIIHKRRPENDCLVATRISEAVQFARDVAHHVRTRGDGAAPG